MSAQEAFARALSAAIERSGASYRSIAERVSQLDGALSAPTLRAWASGRSVPTRRSSFASLAVLEQILGEEPGMLARHLHERPKPADAVGATERLRTLVDDVEDLRKRWDIPPFVSATRDLLLSSLVLEGPRGGTVLHRSLVRAVHEGVPRLLLPVDPMGWQVTDEEDWSLSLRGGRLGRYARLNESLAVIEVELPRPLHAGEMTLVDLSYAISEQDRTSGWFNALSLIPTRRLVAKVTVPAGVGTWFFRSTATTIDGSVHAPVSPAPGSPVGLGVYGNGYDCAVSDSSAAIATVCWSSTGDIPDVCGACD